MAVGVDMATSTPRHKDPIRKSSPRLVELTAVDGNGSICILGDTGCEWVYAPEDATLESESHRLRSQERAEQSAAGGMAHSDRCWTPNQPANSRCSRCQQARFCGQDCQISLWRTHKPVCKKSQKESLGRALLNPNAGWLITPEECDVAAQALGAPGALDRAAQTAPNTHNRDDFRRYLESFAVYCESAKIMGGFYVW